MFQMTISFGVQIITIRVIIFQIGIGGPARDGWNTKLIFRTHRRESPQSLNAGGVVLSDCIIYPQITYLY